MTAYSTIAFFCILLISCHHGSEHHEITQDSLRITDSKKVLGGDYFNLADQFDDEQYSEFFRTSLKGGYRIVCYSDSTNQYLIYKIGTVTIDTIAQCSRGLPFKTLGFVAADFKNVFVLAHSFGIRNPMAVEIYNKKTAEDLIKKPSALIAIDDHREIVLFSENDVPEPTDSFTLFDARAKSMKKYEFPIEIFGEPEICSRIHLKAVTQASFIIAYEFNNRQGFKERKYIR